MKIYRMYIRDKLNYGAPVYASASKAILDTLNPITTEALRIATGALKSTLTDTLYVLTNEMKFDHRKSHLSLRYYYKIKSDIINPVNSHIVPLHYRTLFRNKKIAMPLGLRVQNMIERYELRKIYVKPTFS